MAQIQYLDSYQKFLGCCYWDELVEERIKSFDEREFSSVESALFIGCGSGLFEIKHLSKVIPRLKSATLIESAKSSFEKLQKNLKDFKEDVDTKTHMCKLEDWDNKGEMFDLVVLYHSLYYFRNTTCFLDMCFRRLLRPGGILYVEVVDDTISKGMLNQVLDELKIENQLGACAFKSSLKELVRETYKEHKLKRKYRLEKLEECADFLQVLCDFRRSKAEVLEAIRAVRNKGYNGRDDECMYLVKNI